METFVQWELGILHQIQDGATAFGDVFWTVITYFGESGIFWILLSITLMMFQKTRRCGMTMGIALLLGLILGNGVMKNLFARPRPYHLDPTLSFRLLWSEMSTDFSFPSGHTLASFEAATSIFLYYKKWGIATLSFAALIGISRIFLLVHYPSDVLAGALFGILFAVGASFVAKNLYFILKQKFVNF